MEILYEFQRNDMKRNSSGPERGKDLFDLDLKHGYLFFRRTKIVATIGPASSSSEKIRELILKGLNVARINFSHGEPDEHLRTIRSIRKISRELNKPVAIIGDLCGPKIRVGKFVGGEALLKENSIVTITGRQTPGTATLIPCSYARLKTEVSPNDRILFDDGNLELKALGKLKDGIQAKVIRGGMIRDHKGMNLPNTKMHISALTSKDRKDVLYCIRGQVDFIALSFVRKAADVLELKNLLLRRNSPLPVIAKIEKPEALHNIHEIIAASDGVMIARGDLGVELPAQKVPFIQGKLIESCIRSRKPVIVATQMLESMMEHARPTRAEVTDVSSACLSGADAVMLSGETAVGKYPVEAVEMMDSILREAEAYSFFSGGGLFRDTLHRQNDRLNERLNDQIADNHIQDSVGFAIAQLSGDLPARCIIAATHTGCTASVISSDRPAAPIIALTFSARVLRRLQLYWGVYPYIISSRLNTDKRIAFAASLMKGLKLAHSGDFMVMVRGIGQKKTVTQSITIHEVE